MHERTTPMFRQAILLADEERPNMSARVGTAHLLLGLLREEDGIGGQALRGLDMDLERAREIAQDLPQQPLPDGAKRTAGQRIQYTAQARAAVEGSSPVALHLGHNYIGSEHLLLSLVRQEGTSAQQLLQRLDVTPAAVEAELRERVHVIGGRRP